MNWTNNSLFNFVKKVLKELKIPFNDPCDTSYTGDCICSSGSVDIQPGTNVTITGDGSVATPYIINSTGGGSLENVTINAIAGQTPITNPPVGSVEGDEFINTTSKTEWIYDGATWIQRPGASTNLPIFTTYALAFAALGAGKEFRYATANLEGVPSPNNSVQAFT